MMLYWTSVLVMLVSLSTSGIVESEASAGAELVESVELSERSPFQGFQLDEEIMRGLIAVYFPPKWHDWALRVSWCESHWYTAAKNPRSSAAGLFQFLRSTWDWVAEETGTPSYDSGGVWEVHSQLVNAAWLVTEHGPSHWVCK